MRRKYALAALLAAALAGACSRVQPGPAGADHAGLSGAGSAQAASQTEIIDVRENVFVGQINDIFLNPDEYLGKTVRLEGMFERYTWEEAGMTYYLVYRNSPGCCGADGQAGFEVSWPQDAQNAYPNDNDWVEAVGVLEKYDEDGCTYLRLGLVSLTVKAERGAEFVSR